MEAEVLHAKTACLVVFVLALLSGAGNAKPQSSAKGSAKSPASSGDFATDMQKLRDTWVEEFNAGHAAKLAAFYAPEAVLMRWDGSVHGYDSILAEFQRSVAGGAHG